MRLLSDVVVARSRRINLDLYVPLLGLAAKNPFGEGTSTNISEANKQNAMHGKSLSVSPQSIS